MELLDFFTKDLKPGQKQYEAIRAVAFNDSIIYTRADIKRSESSAEIRNFVDYRIDEKGIVDETPVFDSKLTRYDILYEYAFIQ